jgi:hypothetical protein
MNSGELPDQLLNVIDSAAAPDLVWSNALGGNSDLTGSFDRALFGHAISGIGARLKLLTNTVKICLRHAFAKIVLLSQTELVVLLAAFWLMTVSADTT